MTAVRTLANVRVRTAPSTRARIQKVVPANHWVAQAGRDAAAESRGWWRVSIDGGKTSGWMHADYVDPLWIHQTQCGTLPTPWPVPAEHLARYRAASGR